MQSYQICFPPEGTRMLAKKDKNQEKKKLDRGKRRPGDLIPQVE